jgi:glycosyltransferase involved in cell wall biosynthesis
VRIWLVKDAEPLPIAGSAHRMRMGRLADTLVARGHDITWWHSTFYHFSKSRLAEEPGDRTVGPGYRLRLIEAGTYRGNLTWSRYLHHRRLARGFLQAAEALAPPDVIVAACPIPWLAHAAVAYGTARGVPTVVDVRDLWPDIFVHKSPVWFRPMAWAATRDMAAQVRWLLGKADSLVAVSDGYLRWASKLAGRPIRPEDRVLPLGYRQPALAGVRESVPPVIQRLLPKLSGRVVVTFTGSFGRSYDLQTVCDAAERLQAEGRADLHFVIAGDGEQHAALAQRAKILANVSLPGWLEKEEMDSLLAVSDLGLVCCSSVSDTLPNKIFQYLAFGLPLVSSLEGEAERLIDQDEIGVSYPAGDAGALATCLRSLAGDSARRHLQAANARRLFREKYDAEVIDHAYASHVERIGRLGCNSVLAPGIAARGPVAAKLEA